MGDIRKRIVVTIILMLTVFPNALWARSAGRTTPPPNAGSHEPVTRGRHVNPDHPSDYLRSPPLPQATQHPFDPSLVTRPYLFLSQNEQKADRQTQMREILALDTSLPKFRADRLSFSDETNVNNAFYDFIRLLHSAMPGQPPVLGLFLHPETFALPISKFGAAWKSGESLTEVPANPVLLDQYFSLLKGRTVILVGHIEEGSFAFDYGSNVRIPLATAKAIASRHGVLLLPIGCNTADSGVPFGFRQNIDTEKLVHLLEIISVHHRFGDLLAAMLDVGNVVVDAKAMTLQVLSIRDTLARSSITLKSVNDATGHEQFSFIIPTDINLYPSPSAHAEEDGVIQNKYSEVIHNNSLSDKIKMAAFIFGPFTLTIIIWLIQFYLNILLSSNWLVRKRNRIHFAESIKIWRDVFRGIFPLARTIFGLHAFIILVAYFDL